MGQAHLDWTSVDKSQGGTFDLPLLPAYPPPGSSLADPVDVHGGAQNWGFRPTVQTGGLGGPGTDWDTDNPGMMQVLFGDASRQPAPMLFIFGPAQIGTDSTYGQGVGDRQIVLRLPGQAVYAENRSLAAGATGVDNTGGCSLTVSGSPSSRLDGAFRCSNMGAVFGMGVPPPPVINVVGTFSIAVAGSNGGGGSGSGGGNPGTTTAPPEGTDGPGGPDPGVVVAAGGAGVVAIGGIVVWRRRKRVPPRRMPPPLASGVPPNCLLIAQRLDQTTATLVTLQEAAQDLRKEVERAETIHRNNLIKARMVVNIEIISTLGNLATDFTLALRPAVLRRPGPGTLGQQDTWKPPGGLSASVTAAIQRAEGIVERTAARLTSLTEEAGRIATTIEQRVSELPAVRAARQVAEDSRGVLEEYLKDFAASSKIRTELTELESTGQGLSKGIGELNNMRATLETQIGDLESRLNQAKNSLSTEQGLLPRDLAKAQEELQRLHASGVEDTMRLGDAQDLVDHLRSELERSTASPGAQAAQQDIAQLEKRITQEQTNLGFLNRQFEDMTGRSEAFARRRDELRVQLREHRDLFEADVNGQRQFVGGAEQREADAVARGRQDLSQEVASREAEFHDAQVDAATAQGILEELREEAERQATHEHTKPGGVLTTVGGWLKYPFTVMGELVFGVGQSPEEIVEILRSGYERVRLLRSREGAVTNAISEEYVREGVLTSQLNACVIAHGGQPIGAQPPTMPAVRPANPRAPESAA